MQRLLIQPDWNHFFNDYNAVKETIWVQYKNSESPAVNGKVLLENYKTNDLTNKEKYEINLDFSIESITREKNSIRISYLTNFASTFISPIAKYGLHLNKKDKKQPVYNIDITENGLGVSSSSDGSLLVWTLEDGQIRRNLAGHISDVYVSKFFPSGIVVLSGGSDMRLKIWSVENGDSPVKLGHRSGISDVCIVDKGRNIVSVGRNGSCQLWDVGESKCLATFGNFGCIINSISIESLDKNKKEILPVAKEPMTDREIGTDNKLICCACEDGYLRVIGLRSREQIFEYKCESAVNCCCFLNQTTIACGTQNGHIYVLDIQNKDSAIESWKEFRSSILSMKKFEPTNGLIITTADGSCFIHSLDAKNKIIELIGADCDHVYKAAYNRSFVFTCCRDGYIRKYDINHILDAHC